MAISLRCDCGRKLKLRDELAGKEIRCPDCAEVLSVPKAKAKAESYDYDDEEDDFEDEAPRRSSSGSRGSGRRGRAPVRKSGGNGLIIGLAVGGVVVLGLLVAGIFLFFRSKPNNVAPIPPIAAQPIQQPAPQPAPNVPANNQVAAQQHAVVPPVANGHAAAPAVTATVPNQVATTPQPMLTTTPVAAAAGPEVWVVLTNFRKQPAEPGKIAFGDSYAVDYRVASGAYDPSKKYVLHVRSPSGGGIIERYLEVNLPTQPSGTVNFSPGPGFSVGSSMFASAAYRVSPREHNKVSGEITVGGAETAATPPPSVQQIAGAAAQGKLLAIANAKFEKNGPFPTVTLDVVLQTPADGMFYFLIAKSPSGDGVEFDISHDLRLMKVGEKKTIGGRILGARTTGTNFTLHIEKRKTPGRLSFDKTPPEIVSNSVTTP